MFTVSCRVIAGVLLGLGLLAGCAESTTSSDGLTPTDADVDDARVDEDGPVLDASHPPNRDGDDSGQDAAAEIDGAVTQLDGATEDGAVREDAAVDDGAVDASAVDASAVDASAADGGDDPVDPDPLPSGDHVTLGFRIVDAEYSRALDRVVLVSAEPARVIVLDPESATIEEVALPSAPSSVSVDPSGTSAVIGHNGYVSVVDLDPLVLLETWPVTVDVADIVLADDGHAYAFSNAFSGGDNMRVIDLATGAEALGNRLSAFTVARLHPAGNRMYGAERNVSPSDILRIALDTPITLSYDSPYHGEYATGRNLWLSDDGTRIFGALGDVFRASDVRSEDITYRGSLEGRPYIQALDHASAASLVAAAHVSLNFDPGDPYPLRARLLSVYEDEFLSLRQTVTLPSFEVAGAPIVPNGRFVFFRSDGTRLYALVDAGENVAPLNNSALVRYTIEADEDLDPIVIDDPPVDPPVPAATPSAGVMLDFDVADAEYSRALDRIVIVAPDPDRLIALDPASGELDDVALPLAPSAVSIHPDGASAAVAHDAFVSLVDLDSAQLIETFPVTADLFDVVLAGNGYAYATPSSPSQWQSLHSVQLSTGEETWAYTARQDTIIRLHPAGDRMYGADRGLSPSDIARFNIAAGTGRQAYDSPYHGDYPMCGNLWFSEDGARIFTACGHVFHASNVRADDMTYDGALEGALRVQHLEHSVAAGLIAVVTLAGHELLLFDDELLQTVAALPLPSVTVSGRAYATIGRFAFFSADGSAIYVVAEAATAPIEHNVVLVTFTP